MTASINMDTTAPRVANHRWPLAGYSLRGFLQFITHNTGRSVVTALFLLLAFGQKLFSNTLSLTWVSFKIMMHYTGEMVWAWTAGLVLFQKLTGTYLYNNALASFTMVVFFGMSAVVWACFHYAQLLLAFQSCNQRHSSWFLVVSPIFAES